MDTSGNIVWVSKDKYVIPEGKRVGSQRWSMEYMTDSIIYVIQSLAASSVDNTIYLDEEHRYQVPKCYDLTDNNSDMTFYKKISRRTGEYLGSGTICPKGTSRSEGVYTPDLFEVNDTLYAFVSYIKQDYENTGALSSELVRWDKDGNFLGALDTIATFSETKEPFYPSVYATGDGRVLVYGNWTVMYSQAPIYFNDTTSAFYTGIERLLWYALRFYVYTASPCCGRRRRHHRNQQACNVGSRSKDISQSCSVVYICRAVG